jgi:ParB-like chromosome segregation protein Spo0J
MSEKKKKTAKGAPPQSKLVPIESIHPWVDNPRKNAHAVEKVRASIRKFGIVRPIVANSHPRAAGEIIVGHTLHLAALAEGLTHVPVHFVRLTPKLAHAAAIADNKLGEISGWDTDLLAELAKQGVVGLDDLAVAGFSADELERLGKPADVPTVEQTTTRETKITCPKCKHRWAPKRKAAA